MAVGVVPDDAVTEPEDVPDAEVGAEMGLDAGPVEPGVAVGIEETGLGRDERAPAVHVDRAALQDDPGRVHRQAQLGGDARGDHVVEVVGRVFAAPGVVAPVHDGLLTRPARAGPLEEDRPVVAAPGIVGGVVMEEDVPAAGALVGQPPADLLLHPRAAHVDVHLLAVREMAHHAGEEAGHRTELSGPGRFLVRPAEPGAPVGLPLRRHPEAEVRRRGARNQGRLGGGGVSPGSDG